MSDPRATGRAVTFDFVARKCGAVSIEEVRAAVEAGRSCWVDVDTSDHDGAASALRRCGIEERAIEQVLVDEATSRLITFDDCLHVSLNAASVVAGELRLTRLDLVLAHELIVTLHRGPSDVIEQVERTYEQDFERFAKSIGFVLYDVFDRLAEGYRRAIRATEAEVEEFQSRIFADVDDEIFSHVAHAHRDLLALRTALLGARDLLHQLATRRSPHVSETTQPFLENVVGALERLGSDLGVAREILAESLDLYMGIVSHRTNRVVSRLTGLSVVFLPLTFLCGVYGMNFKHLPELEWRYGYAAFWGIALTVASGLVVFMRRRKWL